MKLIEEALIEYYGERCPDFAEGCPCCEAWAEFDALITRCKQLEQINADLCRSHGVLNVTGAKLDTKVETLENQLAVMKKALEPFAKDANKAEKLNPNNNIGGFTTARVRDLRKARSALEGK